MKSIRLFAFVITLFLVGLLFVPLDGSVENTFVFFLGHFHPLLLHLPIGSLIILLFMETINHFRPNLNLGSACQLLLWFSVISIIPTVFLGVLLGSKGSYDDDLLNIHKWLGWFTALTCVWLVAIRTKHPSRFYKVFLFVNVILLSLAGHYGGHLTHGKNYLTKYMPLAMKGFLGIESSESEYVALNQVSDSTSQEAIYFKENIRPILETHCYACHGEEKQKGEMRLDVLDWDMINGYDAERWHSALNVINLGEMPPEDEKQFSDQDRLTVVNWMTQNLKTAAIAKQKDNRTVMRRLTREQYTNSLNELLGVSVRFGDVLPEDGKSKMGFSNNGNILQTSALHIDYYQSVAREALDKAIMYGKQPPTKRYKVSIGKQKGDGLSGAEFGGYQTAPINNEDFSISLLDANGNSIENETTQEEEDLVSLKNKIGLGMRGSASNRYSTVPEGLILYAALPAKEVTPKSWQGPSPNLKLLIKEEFPRAGDFAFRVTASKGYYSLTDERLIDLRKETPAKVSSKSIQVQAKDLTLPNNVVLKKNRWVVPKEVAVNVETAFTYTIPKAGIYQIDLIHPYAPNESVPSYRISFFNRKKEGVVSKRLNLSNDLKDAEQIISPVTMAYFEAGKHKGYIGGKFFVGFSHLVFTPIAEDDPLHKILEKEAVQNNSKYENINPSLQAFAGSRTDDGMDYKTLGKPVEISTPMGKTKTFEFTGRLENFPIPMGSDEVSGELANILTFGVWNNHLVKDTGLKGPPLLIKEIEFEAPYFPVWPPKSYTQVFFDSPNKENAPLYAQEVISRFMQRAFRRPLNPGELNRYMEFWNSIKDDFDHFEESVKEVLIAVLCSPNFIYITEPKKPDDTAAEDEFYLASQLSYFLWNAPPDRVLSRLASEGDLYDELSDQIERMIKSPKIENMIHSFAYEWLRLDRHKNMDVNVDKYRDYTRFVKADMFEETYQFIDHVLQNNLSIMNFIDSDFAMLNQNLAEFYGVEGVSGNNFRPVLLEEQKQRGGLLSQGSFLTGHSDGLQAHTIKRAVWLKEKILGDHPPPPPPNVPELDPETPGFENLSLKEQLFLHRNKASCMDCHQKIDPYGVVFENYDATGRFHLISNGTLIDTKSLLPDGTEVVGIEGIKDYILQFKKDEFTKAFVENLFAYAVGRDVGFADVEEINHIVEEVIDDDYRFQTVIEQIVRSPSFYKKELNWYHKIFGG